MCLFAGFKAIISKSMSSGGFRRGYRSQPMWCLYDGQAQAAGAVFVLAGIVAIFSFWWGLFGFAFSSCFAWLVHFFSPQD
jgi:hypothetical protein